MLQNIRDKSQGWLAWLVVGILIATFALWGIHSYVSGSSKDTNVAAYVNKNAIGVNQVNAAYERLRQQEQYQLGADFSMNQSAEMRLKKQALNQLVVSKVLLQAANKAGYRVTTGQVDEALLQIPAFQVNGQFSVDRFHDILNGMLYSQDQFLADMRESMLVSQVEGGYVNSAFALPNEVNDAICLVNQKRDMSYVIIPASRFNKQIQVSNEEIKNYYQTHQAEFQSPEQVSVQYLELSLPTIKAGLKFDKTKLQQYYENNLQNYTQPASWHVAHILVRMPQDASPTEIAAAQKKLALVEQQLKNGVAFSKVAKQYSDDTVSAAKGGELPWFSAGTLDPAFEKAVANLQKINAVSIPIKTSYGFSVIQLLGMKKAQVLPFNQVVSQVQNALAAQQAQQIFADESDKLSNLTYANPDNLSIAAKALGLTIQNSELFGKNGTKTGITANPRVINAAFSADVLTQGNNSDVLQLDPNTAVVLRINQHKPAAILPLADIENTIQSHLTEQKAQQQAQQLGDKLLAQLQSKKTTPAQFAKQYKLSWQIDKNAGRYDAKIDSAILNQAFHMPHPTADSLSIAGIKLPSGDYAVVMVNAVHDGQLTDSDNVQRRIFTEQIENNYGRIDYSLYVRQLMDKAKIQYNQATMSPDNNPLDNADQTAQ